MSDRMEDLIENFAEVLEKDPQFKKKLIDKLMSVPKFRRMVAKMIAKELLD